MILQRNQLYHDGSFIALEKLGTELSKKFKFDIDDPFFTFIDVETTGLDYKKDKIIQLSLVCARETSYGSGINVPVFSLNFYQDPGIPIPENITKLTGITDDMVKGQSIEWWRVEEILANSQPVVAHNAGFDRPFIDKHLKNPEKASWACTMQDIPWDEAPGFGSRKLEFILFKYGWFYESHNALADCFAGIQLLNEQFPGQEKMNDEFLTEKWLGVGYRIAAHGAPFSKKDILRSRGYKWQPCDGQGLKYWYIDVTEDGLPGEINWLSDNIPCEVMTGRLNSFNRFSDRILLRAHGRIEF